ncbi:MAG: PAS domain S-box protein [Ignavibacteriaceae bacterium]|nr:PAS domain S-box protein [Ignavibacteriaceae bacterium]
MKLLNASARLLAKKSHILVAALILSIPLLTAVFLYYRQVTFTFQQQKSEELRSVAGLKTGQLVNWRKERTFDAYVFSSSSMTASLISEYIQKPAPAVTAEINLRMSRLFSNTEYISVFFTDSTGSPFLAIPDTPAVMDSYAKEIIKESFQKKEIIHTDFYFCSIHQQIHYDVIAPVKKSDDAVFAVMVFRIDPYQYLYPYIQTWPGKSRTAETLLIRKERDSVVFLNEVRHLRNTALQMYIPFSRNDVAAIKAVKGYTGFLESDDYRGKAVLAYLGSVPGTDWFFVAKIDKDELYQEITFITWLAAGFIVFMLLAIVLGLLWLYHLNQRNIYRQNWEKEQTHKTVLRSIGDAVITTDSRGVVSFLNPAAEKLTGWSLHDASGKPADNIFWLLDENTLEHKPAPVAEVLSSGKPVNIDASMLLKTRGGSYIPIADSCAPIVNEKGEVAGSVIVFRDQSTSRLRSKMIQAHFNLLNYAADHSQNEILTRALDEMEKLTGSTIGFLHFVLEDQETISLQAWSTNTRNHYCKAEGEGLHYNVSQAGIWTECIYTKAPVIHNDYSKVPGKKGLPDGHAELLRELVIPVIRNGLVVAIIGLGNKPEEYTGPDVLIASYFSDIIWEISEKKRFQAETEERERKFVALFSSMNEGVALHELIFNENNTPVDYLILDVNPAYEKMTGLTAQQVKDKPARQAYSADESPYFDIYKEVALSGKPGVFETYYAPLDKYFLISAFRTGENRFATSFQDLTEWKKADIAFRESARAFNTMIDNLSGVVYRCKNDRDWTMEYISDGINLLSGYPKADFIGSSVRTFASLIHPDDQEMVWQKIQSALEIEVPYVIEYRIITALGETKWVWERGTGIYTGGNLTALEGFISDITLVKTAENEIRHLNRLYAMLSQTNKTVAKLPAPGTLFRDICRIAVQTGEFALAWVGELTDNGEKLIPLYALGTGSDVILEKLPAATEEELRKKPCFTAVKENRIIVQNNLQSFFDEDFLKIYPEMGQLKSLASAPVLHNGKAKYVLSIFSSEVNFFRQKELNLLEEIALDITFAVANYQKELQRSESEKRLIESERKYSDLYEYSPDMFVSIDPKTARIIECNHTATILTGYTKEELIGKPVNELYHPRSYEDFKRNLEKFRREGKIVNAEMEVVRKDGTLIYILLNSSAVYDSAGSIIRSRSVWRDITAQKQLEAEEKRLWEILKTSLNEIYIFNRSDLKFRFVNEGALRNLGYTSDEITRMTPVDIKPDYTLETFMQAISPLTSGQKELITFTTRHRRKDGSVYDVEVHLQLHPFGTDQVFVAMIMDITERIKAEEQLRLSGRIVSHSLDLLCVAGYDGYFKMLNPAWEKTLGWSIEEMLSKPWNEFIHPDDRERTNQANRSIIDGREVFEFENRYLCRDGSVRWLSWVSHPYPEEQVSFAVAHDITNRKLMQDSLKESEERYRKLIEVSQDAIYINFNNEIVYCNPGMMKMVGARNADQILGKAPFEFFHPDDHEDIKNRVSSSLSSGEYAPAARRRLVRLDGTVIDIEATATPFAYKNGTAILVVIRDITERLRYENALQAKIQELEQFNKLSVGRELMMIELKKKINELSVMLGQQPVYNLEFITGGSSDTSGTDDAHKNTNP